VSILLTQVLPELLMAASDDSSDSGDGIWWLLASGPAAGAAMYTALFRYYRNTDKSHNFEHETRVLAKPVDGDERKVDHIRGTSASRTKDHNESNHRQRVERIS